MPRPSRPFVLATAALAALVLPGCASDTPTEGVVPERPTVERPEGLTPEGVSDVRESLGDRRSESRDLMDSTLLRPSAAESPGAGSEVLDFLSSVTGTVLDAVSLRAFGIW